MNSFRFRKIFFFLFSLAYSVNRFSSNDSMSHWHSFLFCEKKNCFFFQFIYHKLCILYYQPFAIIFILELYFDQIHIFYFRKIWNYTFINFERKAYLNFTVFSHIYISFTSFLIIINRYIVLALFNIIIFSVLSTFFLFFVFYLLRQKIWEYK